MKGLLIYFSGTGNTKIISQRIKDNFNKRGHNVTLYSIEDTTPINWNGYDFLILGSPKYYEHTPLFFINWVKKNIPTLSNEINCLLFCTSSNPLATTFKSLEKILKNKNIKVVSTRTFEMPNNYLIGLSKPSSPLRNEIYSDMNHEKICFMIEDFLDEIYSIEKISPLIGFACKHISHYLCKTAKYKCRKFSISDLCTHCNKCVEICPTKNIEVIDNKLYFKDNCILCTRCINHCPVNAILYKNKHPIQYNSNTFLNFNKQGT